MLLPGDVHFRPYQTLRPTYYPYPCKVCDAEGTRICANLYATGACRLRSVDFGYQIQAGNGLNDLWPVGYRLRTVRKSGVSKVDFVSLSRLTPEFPGVF